jgi:hypothetical protein
MTIGAGKEAAVAVRCGGAKEHMFENEETRFAI